MDIDAVREFCLSLPHATENVQWGSDLVFKIGGKMFTVVGLEEIPCKVSFKCKPEEFAALIEHEGIVPAQYVARYHWVSLVQSGALDVGETKRLIRKSYDLVLGKLPRKVRVKLGESTP